MDKYRHDVELSLKNVERVFSGYQTVFPITGSPVSVGPELEKALETSTYETLPRYLFSALSTWGMIDDFKSFLPTLLRMMVFDAGHLWTNDILISKLYYAKFLTWDIEEVTAITDFFDVTWRYILAEFERPNCIYLYDFIRDVPNPQPYLDYWETQLNNPAALCHLVRWVNHDYNVLTSGFNAIGAGVVQNKWVLREENLHLLETAFFEHADSKFASDISAALEHLKWIHQQMDDKLAKRLGLNP